MDALHQLLDLHADLEHHYRATAQLWDRLTHRQDRHLLDPRWQDLRWATATLDASVEALDDAEVELLAAWARLSVGLVWATLLAADQATDGTGPDRPLIVNATASTIDLAGLLRRLKEFDVVRVGAALGRDQRETDYLDNLRAAAMEAVADAHRATRAAPGVSLDAAAKENLVTEVTESCEVLGDLSNALLILLGRD